jgi:hypothetical protein
VIQHLCGLEFEWAELDEARRVREVRMIQRIKSIRSKLQVQSLAQRE